MPQKYVFANTQNGRSDIVSQVDLAELTIHGSFLRATDLWLNRETPADLSTSEDPVVGRPMSHEPPDGGAVFRMLVFPPVGSASKDELLAFHSEANSVHVPASAEFPTLKDPSMHKTDTLNYFCLVYGELWALSEGRDVLMRPGDVVIQQGCMHGWRNDGSEDACLICVLIDSKPAP